MTGTSRPDSEAAAALACRHPSRLRATAGVHPHEAATFDGAASAAIEALAGREEVVAVGETGLDFYRDFSPRPDQERAFEAQLEIAARLGLPVFLHERAARRRFVEILRPVRDRLGPAVIHCFTGDREDLDAYLDLDLHVGITGWICDERRGLHLRDLAGRVPGRPADAGDRLPLSPAARPPPPPPEPPERAPHFSPTSRGRWRARPARRRRRSRRGPPRPRARSSACLAARAGDLHASVEDFNLDAVRDRDGLTADARQGLLGGRNTFGDADADGDLVTRHNRPTLLRCLCARPRIRSSFPGRWKLWRCPDPPYTRGISPRPTCTRRPGLLTTFQSANGIGARLLCRCR